MRVDLSSFADKQYVWKSQHLMPRLISKFNGLKPYSVKIWPTMISRTSLHKLQLLQRMLTGSKGASCVVYREDCCYFSILNFQIKQFFFPDRLMGLRLLHKNINTIQRCWKKTRRRDSILHHSDRRICLRIR